MATWVKIKPGPHETVVLNLETISTIRFWASSQTATIRFWASSQTATIEFANGDRSIALPILQAEVIAGLLQAHSCYP